MREVCPEFYTRFACKASACRHSCCRGWEIDVDGESAALYGALPGALGEELRAALVEDSAGFHFRLDAEKRCPFLRPDGLCRLILSLGEDALCDICALHPRFFGELGDFTFAGLGLSCERVCELLLEDEAPLRFLCGGEPLTLAELLARLGVPGEGERLRFAPPQDAASLAAMLARYGKTEPIDEAWPEEVALLENALPALVPAEAAAPRFDRILAYILFRQLPRLADTPAERLLAFAQEAAQFVFLLTAQSGDLAEALRRWSEQIEYDTDNVDILLRDL